MRLPNSVFSSDRSSAQAQGPGGLQEALTLPFTAGRYLRFCGSDSHLDCLHPRAIRSESGWGALLLACGASAGAQALPCPVQDQARTCRYRRGGRGTQKNLCMLSLWKERDALDPSQGVAME